MYADVDTRGQDFLGSLTYLTASETAQLQQFPLVSATASTTVSKRLTEDKSRGKKEGETLTPVAGKSGPVPYTSPLPLRQRRSLDAAGQPCHRTPNSMRKTLPGTTLASWGC